MGKISAGLVGLLGMLVSQASLAGGALVGSSTLTLNWTSGATAVPTLGVYGTIALALLVMVVLLRVLRNRPAVVRTVAPAAGLGLVLGAGLWVEDITAGIAFVPDISANSCNGSQTYTAQVEGTPPPCFVNTCGAPVTVSYTFVSGTDFTGVPLTAEQCNFAYFCDGASGEMDVSPEEGNRALNGSLIPSDGMPYATAYCLEIIGDGLPG
jgi:hypothetical protein